jgi:quercetin dioxygenase-like cupin family protein
MRPNSILTIGPTEGQHISVVGDTYRILTSGQQTNGAYAVIDMLVPPGGGPGPHAHASFAESFYVVEGELVVRSETQTYTAGKGAFVNIPAGGAIHNFKNESDRVAHLLCIVVPAGLDQFFVEIGKPVAEGVFLPPGPIAADELEKLMKIAEKYGQELFPPDYFDK